MSFNPKTEYTTISTDINIKDFSEFGAMYVTRPPYQRKSVWSQKKKQALMDSLFRRYYIPKLVIREVRLSDTDTVREIIDGQQRITTVQEFFRNEYPLPKTLSDLGSGFAGKLHEELDVNIQMFISRELKYQADIIKHIDNPRDVNHQITATEIFWRLQQGESLNYMEVAHAKLSSLTRNFIVKYADDQRFDYGKYKPIDSNPDKKDFFFLLDVDNTRMKHLQFMARFLMIERGDGYADLSDKKIGELIDEHEQKDGIGNFDYENTPEAQATLKTLKIFHEIFKGDPMLDQNTGIKELSVEYFIISLYLLIRHLHKCYVIDDTIKPAIKNFIYEFHHRWKTYDETEDTDLLTFSNSRQQGEKDLETRDMILRQVFFKYLHENNIQLVEKDSKRAFSELERIIIYRKGKGLCQECLKEGKPESEARVSWSQYQADHVIPHSKGGKTDISNAQLLCRYHNQHKGATVTTENTVLV